MTFEDYVREHLDRANLSHKGLELVRMGWNGHGKYGDSPEGGEAVEHDWVDCPVCGEPDMQRTFHGREHTLIHCCNHNCLSNGGTNASAITHPSASVPERFREQLEDLVSSAFHDNLEDSGMTSDDCIAGVDRLMSMLAATNQPADNWIKCSERLPVMDDYVVWYWDDYQGIALLPWSAARLRGKESPIHNPHWMPTGLKRPTPPEEGAEG